LYLSCVDESFNSQQKPIRWEVALWFRFACIWP
jgi:hypothetical protein